MDRLFSMALFVAAVDEGSLAAAGRRFGLAPAVAGKHVSALESQLGARLLHRTTRKLSLTEAGQAFLIRCRRILAEFDDAQREAGNDQRQVSGTLRVAVPTEFAVSRLGGMLARYAANHPAVHLNLSLDDRYVDLITQEIDVAIRIGRLTDPGLVVRRLGRCRLLLCASPAFIARHGDPQHPSDVDGAPRLVFSQSVSPQDWTLTGPDGQVHPLQGHCAVSANNVQLLAEIAAAGVGLAYGPDFVFERKIASGQLVPLLKDWQTPSLDIHAVYPAARFIPHKVRSFVDALAEELTQE